MTVVYMVLNLRDKMLNMLDIWKNVFNFAFGIP